MVGTSWAQASWAPVDARGIDMRYYAMTGVPVCGAVRNWLGFVWRDLQQLEAIWSSGEVNRLIDGVASVCQPSTLRMVIWPEANKAQNSIAAVSADGSTVWVSIRRLNSSLQPLDAFVVRTLRH